ncbi:MAG: hypothetical protein HYV94_10125, partial [Candidatus Rokubacteria bacterium]|nr:hypothetical protein [Candidatus Rokubacteria bacterium]
GEFSSLSRRYPNFAYHPVVASADGPWRHAPDGLAEVVGRMVADVTGLVAYVAGGSAAIDRVRDVLMARGLDRKSVKWEKFW